MNIIICPACEYKISIAFDIRKRNMILCPKCVTRLHLADSADGIMATSNDTKSYKTNQSQDSLHLVNIGTIEEENVLSSDHE